MVKAGDLKGPLLQRGFLEGDDPGCVETLDDLGAEVKIPENGSDEGPEEGTLPK